MKWISDIKDCECVKILALVSSTMLQFEDWLLILKYSNFKPELE